MLALNKKSESYKVSVLSAHTQQRDWKTHGGEEDGRAQVVLLEGSVLGSRETLFVSIFLLLSNAVVKD
jgi:hypothetical protein